MILRQLNRLGLIQDHPGLSFVLGTALFAGAAASPGVLHVETAPNPATHSGSSSATPATRDDITPVSVRLSEWKLEPSRLTAPTGDIEFAVSNGGTMPHAFEIEGQGFDRRMKSITVGATSTLKLTLPPGSYELYCPIDNGAHEKMGMIAHIEVIGAVDINRLATAMKQGGYVIVLRHGATNPNQADTDPLHRDNIAAQRLLSQEGRDVAIRVGDAFRKLGIPLGSVYSSEFNRATETAKLVSGVTPITTPDLTEGGLVVPPAENTRRAKALITMAAAKPDQGVNTLIVTHKPNILDAFGEDWFDSKEGEASVFKPDEFGDLVLVARVQPADWIKAAGGH
jgi:phosphohistidine phosphatase SixA/plastocyanin